jgi:tol-pal system protein YbgF
MSPLMRLKFSQFITFATLSTLACQSTNAAIFEDNDARRQINVLTESVKNNQKAIFDLTNSFERSVQENSKLRGRIEELERTLDDQKNILKIYYSELNDRLKLLEPVSIEVEGLTGKVQLAEKELYDLALLEFKDGSPVKAEGLLTQFIAAYPTSPYWPVAQYWLSVSKYASKDYKGAIAAGNALIKAFPEHPRVSQTLLNIANCLLESNQKNEGKKTLELLIKNFPESKSAETARVTLSKIK